MAGAATDIGGTPGFATLFTGYGVIGYIFGLVLEQKCSFCAGILVFARGTKSKKKVFWRPDDNLVEVSDKKVKYYR
jgi:hypothetical protein